MAGGRADAELDAMSWGALEFLPVLRQAARRRWPRVTFLDMASTNDDGWHVRLFEAGPPGGPTVRRYAMATIDVLRLGVIRSEDSALDYMIGEVDRAYARGWPPPAPPFRIGLRHPRRLQPPRKAA